MTQDFIPAGHTVIGTCSRCGGPVTTISPWGGVTPAPVSCMRCGAVPASAYGPVIPMRSQGVGFGELTEKERAAWHEPAITTSTKVDADPSNIRRWCQ